MPITISCRGDFTLPHYFAVAWQGAGVVISSEARDTVERSREAFLRLLDNPEVSVYGVTSGYGQMAAVRLDPEQRQHHAAQPPFASMAGFGGDLPGRIKRGIVFARMTNFIEGHAAVSAELLQAVAGLLQEPLPQVPLLGNTSAGEIVPLSHLFTSMWQSVELGEKEALALINGSPCATALMADLALSFEARLDLAVDVFALAAEALASPHEHYAAALDPLYANPALAEIQARLRARMSPPGGTRRAYQAPVSWRILPGVLGHALNTQQRLYALADHALKTVTDNPVFIPPDEEYPAGQVLSTGGFHNADACAAMDQVAGCCADLSLLCDRQTSKLFDGNVSGLPARLSAGEGYAGCLGFIAADYAQQAKHHAQRTELLGSEGGGFGQNDVASPVFHAWRKAEEAGRCLDACLAVLAVTASQAFHASGNSCPEPLQPLLDDVRFWVPPLTTPRAMGLSVGDVADAFGQRIYRHCTINDSD
ncbi:MAG: aromatic amino acid lyase [Granulosicoccus sp.]|nr:aromatic amino acid lyase [Granulosicoccus sp.]